MRRSKEDAEQTRSAILDAAEVLFCAQGVSASTLDGIARKAGVTRGAVYWHFKDKVDLLRALHDRSMTPQEVLIRTAAQEGHPDPLGLLEQAARDMLALFEQDSCQQRVFLILHDTTPDAEGAAWLREKNAEMSEVLRLLAEQAQMRAQLSQDFTPAEIAVILMASMSGLLSEWLRGGKSFPLADLGGRFIQRQLQMLQARPG